MMTEERKEQRNFMRYAAYGALGIASPALFAAATATYIDRWVQKPFEDSASETISGTMGLFVGYFALTGFLGLIAEKQSETLYENQAKTVVVKHINDSLEQEQTSLATVVLGGTSYYVVKQALYVSPYTTVTVQLSSKEKCMYAIPGHLSLDELAEREVAMPTLQFKDNRTELPENLNERCLAVWNLEKQRMRNDAREGVDFINSHHLQTSHDR